MGEEGLGLGIVNLDGNPGCHALLESEVEDRWWEKGHEAESLQSARHDEHDDGESGGR